MPHNASSRPVYSLGISGLANVSRYFGDDRFQGIAQNGINQGADTSACLLADGQVVAAVAEERFSLEKNTTAFPSNAIRFCLETAGIGISDLDAISFGFDYDKALPIRNANLDTYFQTCLSLNACTKELAKHFDHGFVTPRAFDHHLCHLTTALATCPEKNALGLILDGAAEIAAVSIFDHQAGDTKLLKRWPLTESLGLFYSMVTMVLGYQFNEDEYKVMGAAPKGDPGRFTSFFEEQIVLLPNGRVSIPALKMNKSYTDKLFLTQSLAYLKSQLPEGLEQRPFQPMQFDLCAGLQKRFSEALIHICTYFAKVTGHRTLVLGGGCAENCHAIYKLGQVGLFDRIHVSFASGDDGISLGAATLGATAQGSLPRNRLSLGSRMPFFGPVLQEQEAQERAAALNLAYTPILDDDTMAEDIATRLADRQIVAVCRGGAEFGSRALGNRSILADPRQEDTQKRVNLAIKKRESFRPFAPAVIEEAVDTYFDMAPGSIAPYMTVLTEVRPEWRAQLPAITHLDGTARVQTVNAVENAFFHKVLTAFARLTDVPVLLNTSYNVNGQPIASTTKEVVESFARMDLDHLYTASGRISRKPDNTH